MPAVFDHGADLQRAARRRRRPEHEGVWPRRRRGRGHAIHTPFDVRHAEVVGDVSDDFEALAGTNTARPPQLNRGKPVSHRDQR